jgi:hypothetical protein
MAADFDPEETGTYYEEDFPVLEGEEEGGAMTEYVEAPGVLTPYATPGSELKIYTHAADTSSEEEEEEEEEEEQELAEEERRRQVSGISSVELLRERAATRIGGALGGEDIRNVGEDKIDTSLLTDQLLRQRGLERETARRLAAEQTLRGPNIRAGQVMHVKLMPNFSCRAAGHCKVQTRRVCVLTCAHRAT